MQTGAQGLGDGFGDGLDLEECFGAGIRTGTGEDTMILRRTGLGLIVIFAGGLMILTAVLGLGPKTMNTIAVTAASAAAM